MTLALERGLVTTL